MKKMAPISNQRGQALAGAIVLSFTIVLISGFLLQQSQQTEKTLRVPRVKAVMNSIEAKIRMASLQPQTFNCPATATGSFSSASCTLNSTFSDFKEFVPGCQDATGAPCADGIVVQNATLSGTTLTADLVYEGTEMALKPMHVSIDVPQDVLQASDSNCATIDPTRPLLEGFNPDGSLRCRALPADCPAGQYAASVNRTNLALVCVPLPTPSSTCTLHQYLTRVNWSGGPTFSITCAPRVDPFIYAGFTPTLAVQTTPYSSPTVAPTNGACVPVSTSTTTTSSTSTTMSSGTTTTSTSTTSTTSTTAPSSSTTVTTTSTTTSTTAPTACDDSTLGNLCPGVCVADNIVPIIDGQFCASRSYVRVGCDTTTCSKVVGGGSIGCSVYFDWYRCP